MIDRVTITGADDSINPGLLFPISEKWPIVEWGILLSKNSMGSRRFPTGEWIDELINCKQKSKIHIQLSFHLCGTWLRDLMACKLYPPITLPGPIQYFNRIQLNFHAQPCECNLLGLAFLNFLEKQIIFQMDGVNNWIFFRALNDKANINAVPLFDESHGAGIVPRKWPEVIYSNSNPIYCGYAGGLGPDNLVEEMERIVEVAGDNPIWIDMETKVRSSNDYQFDLNKVETVLNIATDWIRSKKEK